jgi:translation initiation factor IF-2
VRIVGLKGTPPAGADLLGVEDEARAAAVLEGRARRAAAAEASSISAVDAAVRKADRKAYQGRRDRAVAFTLAASRERQRGNMRKAGQIIPTRLQQQPWEVAILAEARTGSIVGVGSSGRKERTQGGQQSAYSATSVAGGEGGSSAPAAPVASLLLRADSMGSLAALKDAVGRIGLATSAVVPRVVTAVVGEVTEKDVEYAANMGAHIVGFGCKASPAVLKLAERKKIKVNVGKVIYHVLDALCGDLGAYLPPEMEEEVTSTAEIKQVFNLNANKAKDATAAAGCVITMGTFLKAAKLFRVMREGEVVHEVKELANLQHLQKKVESVKKGDECGISLNGFKGFQVGDRIETVSIKRKALKIQVSWD